MQSQCVKSNGSILLDYFKSLGQEEWNINLAQYSKLVDFRLTQNVITFVEVQNFYAFEDQKNFLQMHSQTQWTDQEWKILIWIVISYCTMNKMNLLKMNDWEMVEKLIKFKNGLNCQYKWLCHVIAREDRLQWTQEEEQMLKEEVENSKILKWHEIQFQIFMKSNGRYFKKAKQCRERWNNYLDPQINRSNWKPEEDLCLMKLAQSEGLKWSKISYKMKNRTENQVKNRFKSLINKETKGYQQQQEIGVLINNIIQKLILSQSSSTTNGYMQEEKPQKVICLDGNINYLQQQQYLIYQYQYYLAQQQYQMCYSYYQGEQSVKSEECQSQKISRSNSFCGLLDKLSLDSKSLTQELNKQYAQEIEVPINNITKSQQLITIPNFITENQGKVKSNKQRFKFSSGDQ